MLCPTGINSSGYIGIAFLFDTKSSKVPITFAGVPTATELSGISLFTRLPAPIITLDPIFTSYKTVVLEPINTLSPISIQPIFSLYRVPPPPAIFHSYSNRGELHHAEPIKPSPQDAHYSLLKSVWDIKGLSVQRSYNHTRYGEKYDDHAGN